MTGQTDPPLQHCGTRKAAAFRLAATKILLYFGLNAIPASSINRSIQFPSYECWDTMIEPNFSQLF